MAWGLLIDPRGSPWAPWLSVTEVLPAQGEWFDASRLLDPQPRHFVSLRAGIDGAAALAFDLGAPAEMLTHAALIATTLAAGMLRLAGSASDPTGAAGEAFDTGALDLAGLAEPRTGSIVMALAPVGPAQYLRVELAGQVPNGFVEVGLGVAGPTRSVVAVGIITASCRPVRQAASISTPASSSLKKGSISEVGPLVDRRMRANYAAKSPRVRLSSRECVSSTKSAASNLRHLCYSNRVLIFCSAVLMEEVNLNRLSVSEQLRGLVRLTRWKEYVPFVIPLTLAGALPALEAAGALPPGMGARVRAWIESCRRDPACG